MSKPNPGPPPRHDDPEGPPGGASSSTQRHRLRARQAALAELVADAELVAPDVARIPLRTPTLPPAVTTNHYLVGDVRAVLVDPATPHLRSQRSLRAIVALWQREVAPVTALFLTHHHRDHIGAAATLRDQLGLPIWAHAATAALLPGLVDRHVADGEPVATSAEGDWLARHTPGHAPGHLVVHGPKGGMIVGDMVAGQGSILIDPSDGHMGDYLDSLRRMAALEPRWLGPAHGPVLRDPAAVIQGYVSHRLAREAAVVQALSATARPAEALLSAAYADTPRRLWPLALRAMRAHLAWLEAQGLAEQPAPGRWRLARPHA